MYFQSLSSQYKKISEHRWKIATGLLLALAFYIWSSYFFYRAPLTTEQTNDLINRSEPLKRVDSLCENIPKPEDFQFIKKITSGNSRTTSISHYYHSNLGYEKIKKFYSDWFTQNGWEPEVQESLEFRNKNFTISINGYPGGFQYIIHCAEEH